MQLHMSTDKYLWKTHREMINSCQIGSWPAACLCFGALSLNSVNYKLSYFLRLQRKDDACNGYLLPTAGDFCLEWQNLLELLTKKKLSVSSKAQSDTCVFELTSKDLCIGFCFISLSLIFLGKISFQSGKLFLTMSQQEMPVKREKK